MDGADLTFPFARAALRYWLGVFPRLRRQRRIRDARARDIPDPWLAALALEALRKWGNVEGAAAYATLASRRHRLHAARAMTAFQAAYNHLDLLAETRQLDASRLHRALVCALDASAEQPDYYAPSGLDDAGYLWEMVRECRAALGRLPAYPAAAGAALRAAGRIVCFQGLQSGDRGRDVAALCAWGAQIAPPGLDVEPWEAAAAAGSSLGVYALIAQAGRRHARAEAIAAVERAYFPWIGALHSLLDNLIDVAEDRGSGQHNLIERYGSPAHAARRMGLLTREALRAARRLPDGAGHVLIVAAMASFYLSAPQAAGAEAAPVREAVLETIGEPARLAMRVFRARRALGLQPC